MVKFLIVSNGISVTYRARRGEPERRLVNSVLADPRVLPAERRFQLARRYVNGV